MNAATESTTAKRWDAAAADFAAACHTQDARRMNRPASPATTARDDVDRAHRAVFRTVARAYPDARIVSLQSTFTPGERPAMVWRFRVEHANGDTTIVRCEDLTWVVVDGEQPARIGDELAALVAVLA